MRIFKLICGYIGAFAGFLWGQLDGLLLALIAFMVLDYITGVIAACVLHRLDSRVGFTGLAKKALILVIVAVAHIVDTQILGGAASVCRSAVICFYLANEGLSILENAGKLGLPMPKKLRDMLTQLRDESEGDENVHTETDET